MYVIHTDLYGLLPALRPHTPLYVEAFTRQEYSHGLPVRLVSEVLVSGLGADDAAHVARLVVERVDLLQANPRTVNALVAGRAEQARQIVAAALERSGARVARGLVSAPGMYADLAHYEARHGLWHWEQAQSGVRELVDLEVNL